MAELSGPWVAGALVNNIWGFSDTDELNSFLFQYFINYNLKNGWSLVSGPPINVPIPCEKKATRS